MRFPGFDEPWQSTLLSAVFAKNTKKNTDEQITNVICNSAKQGLIPQREYFDKDIANSDNTNGYYIIEENDFVYNPRKSSDAPYGPISSYKYAEAGIVSPLYLCFRAKKEINSAFFEWYFRSSAWHRHVYMSGDSGARHDRVSIKDDIFFAMPINIPEDQEQAHIAAFLEKINLRIEKQRALVETLKKYKRGLISSILNLSLKISHKDDVWEDVSLGDVADGFEYGMNAAATTYDGIHKYIRITDIDDSSHQYIGTAPVSPSGSIDEKYHVKENDILFARTGASVGKSYLYQKRDGDLFFAGFLIRAHVKNNIDSRFVFLNTLTDEYKKWVVLESTRSGQPGINAEQYRHYRFKIPSYITQKKIATIATQYDVRINSETRIMDNLQALRAGILQQLFI